ncbi:MAG: FG-GAP-like repeat-containing protein [Promethearchaeati archaeon SRVP18_Atabeyarchaeia-1]
MRRLSYRSAGSLTCKAVVIMILALSVVASLQPLLVTAGKHSQWANPAAMAVVGGQEPTEASPPANVTTHWTYGAGQWAVSSPVIADVNRDGKLEIIVGSMDNKVYCLNSGGGLAWTYTTGNYAYNVGAVADIDNDSKVEVVFASWDRKIYCLDGAGGQKWNYTTYPNVPGYCLLVGSPTLADIDGDGKMEVIIASDKVWCLNSTGGLKWAYNLGEPAGDSCKVADVDGDGKMEIVFGAYDNKVYCLNATGKLEWTYTTGGAVRTSSAIADVDGDGKTEIVIGSTDNKTYCLGGTGGLKWSFESGGVIFSSPATADVDQDGKVEIVFGSDDSRVYCLSGVSGAMKWNYTTGGYVQSSPTIADIDGDSRLEIIIGSDDRQVYCFDAFGNVEWTYATVGNTTTKPAVADVDGDGALDLVVDSDKVYCFSVPPSRTSLIWGSMDGWTIGGGIAQSFDGTAGGWVEIDMQVSSGMFNFLVLDNSDWSAHYNTFPYIFDHPYANATGVTGNTTVFVQIPLSGQYWIYINTYGAPMNNNSASYQVWLWNQTPPSQTGSLPPGQTGSTPSGSISPLVVWLGVGSVGFAVVAVLAVRGRSKAGRYIPGESAAGPEATVGTAGSDGRAMRESGTPSFGRCIVCGMEIRRGEMLVTCASCGSMAHRLHMLEWLHVHDYCPACGKHLDERSLT